MRFAIDHAGLQDHAIASALLREGLTLCEAKSMIFTSESGIVCIALPGESRGDASSECVTTLVLQIPRSDVDVVVRELVERDVGVARLHYVHDDFDADIRVTSRPPEKEQLAKADEDLPCEGVVGVATLQALSMISWAREHHVAMPPP